tara:strand:- start:1463 stop:2086 length:624 start_codon:yes stop_codon:yes gene_type:complete
MNQYNSNIQVKIMIEELIINLNKFIPKRANGNLPQAAIIILLEPRDNDFDVIFTERSKKLPSHAGEVSFPGGKSEDKDSSLIDTALREAQEEIGLVPENVKILGQLDTQESRWGLSVTPFVGIIQKTQRFIAEPKEVESIFKVPLSYFKDSPEILNKITNASGESFITPVIGYENYKIWGLTLAFTLQFLKLSNIDIEIDDLHFREA